MLIERGQSKENKGLLMNYQAAAEYLSVSERQVRRAVGEA